MKKYIGLLLITVFVTVVLAHSSNTGNTRKTSVTGCSCHGSASGIVTVSISGPSQVQTGSTSTFKITISGGSGTRVCADIAASSGSLQPFDSALKLSGTELITNGTKTYTNGQYTYSFNYTAPATAGSQTLYATGLATNSSGQWNFAPDKIISVVTATDVKNNSIPAEYLLEQNYPNPFNPSTLIKYSIAETENVTLKIYDMLGNEIKTLVNEVKQPGKYISEFSSQNLNLASGIYFYKLQTEKFSSTKKMLLLK